MASSDPSLSFTFFPLDFFFALVALWVEMVELVRLRPFLGGDMGGAGLLRVLGMAVDVNGVAVTYVTKRDNITGGLRKLIPGLQPPFLYVYKHLK
jgi:hypothetical protein